MEDSKKSSKLRMTRIRRMMTKEMLNQQLNTKEEYFKNEKEMTERKRKRKESEEMAMEEDCVQPNGKLIRTSGVGQHKKLHYHMFTFRDIQYQIEDSVLLVPEKLEDKNYVAIIKDIYKEEKEDCMKLKVQWFYRPRDIETKYIGKWKAKDRREIFYSFHCDEVFAESVKRKCFVHFLPENKEFPKDHHGFIVQKVYDDVNKKLMKFSYRGFNKEQKNEIKVLMEKTILRLGDRPDISKKPNT